MEFIVAVVLGVFFVAALAGAFLPWGFGRLAQVGLLQGVIACVGVAILVLRAPDGSEADDPGWIAVFGVVVAFLVGVWILGAATGGALRRLTRAGASMYRR